MSSLNFSAPGLFKDNGFKYLLINENSFIFNSA